MQKNINKKFLVLEVIGIILVVLGHKGGISLFTDWFPIYSFHMPLFVFISGYFYKKDNEKDIKKFIKTKVKKLVIPYFVWNIVYGIMVTLLINNNIINFGNKISLHSLFIEPWISGHQFGLNVAAWFVLALFIIQVIYIFFRKILCYIKVENEYIFMILLLLIGCIGIIQANKGYITGYNLTIVRTMFLIPFYHIGYVYKEKIEQKYTINSFVYLLFLFCVQFILIKIYPDLNFNAVFCNNFNRNNILLPYITSITGIMFWLRISKLLAPSIGENKIIYYVGNNTWTIMMHHQLVFFIINLTLVAVNKIINLPLFNYEQFKVNAWYAYDMGSGHFLLFYTMLGIVIPLTIKFYIQKIVKK